MPQRMILDGDMRAGPAELFHRVSPELYTLAYQEDMNLSEWLDAEDPAENYSADSGLREIDAFDRLLWSQGIRVHPFRRHPASKLEELGNTPQGLALVPEFFARAWREVTGPDESRDQNLRAALLQDAQVRAMLNSQDTVLGGIGNPWQDQAGLFIPPLQPILPLDRLLARTERVQGDNFRQQYLVDSVNDDAYQMKRVGEGAEIPGTRIVTSERTGRLRKFGRRIDASYESLRRLPLDRIRLLIGRIATKSQIDKVGMVISVAINGDGNPNTAARVVNVTTLDPAMSGHTPGISYLAYQAFLLEFGNAYNPNVLLGLKGNILGLLMTPVTGATPNTFPLGAVGAQVIFGSLRPIMADNPTVGWAVSTDAPTDKLIGMDSSRAIVRYEEIGATISEVQRFVKDQTETLTLTESEGYAVEDQGATIVLNEAA